MLNSKLIKVIHYKKIIISMIFGLLGFWLNFHAVHFMQFADLKVSILFGLLFPLIISLFWGWKYGLLSALFGGCQTMWWLWGTDGFGIFYAVPVFTLWIIWHGFWADYRRTHERKWYHNMYIVEIGFRILSVLGFYTIFRWLVSLNPPPWAPQITNNYVSYSWVNFVMIKHIIVAYTLLLIVDVLRHIEPVRKFFILKAKSSYRGTSYIVSASILLGLFFWIVHTSMEYFIFYKGKDTFLNLMAVNIPIKSLFTRNFFLIISLVVGVVLSKIYLQLQKKDILIKESEKKYRTLTETSSDVVFALDTKGRFTYINSAFEKITGYQSKHFLGCSFTKMLVPEYIESTTDNFKKGIEGETTPLYEVEMLHKNGGKIPVELNVSSLFDNEGKIVGRLAVARDITERKLAEKEIKKDLKIKTALIQEIYHRTKNNMAVVSAMLSMKSRRSDNDYVKSTFREINNKIQAMSLVHQKLYKAKDLSNINLKDYIEDLSNLIMQSYGLLSERIKIKFDLHDVKILIDSAIPLGLIINELVSNIFKHAFPENREGEIFIRLFKEKDETIDIQLSDNGVGFPNNFDPRKDGSMGFASVFSIVENQLKGEISVKSENGLRWHIKIKDDKKKERI